MNRNPDSVIALIGFMGSGKTTIGRKLAERLGRDFIDLDSRIEESAGMSIPDFFKKFGEQEFRKIESATLKSEAGKENGNVLACGGGIVENPKNREILTGKCTTIWLDVPELELIQRLSKDFSGRPMLSGNLEERIKLLFERRFHLYASVASIRYSWREGETLQASVDALITLLGAEVDKLQ